MPVTHGNADPLAFDRFLHAQETRITSSLSPSSFWLACSDWAIHLANALARGVAIGMKAVEQWKRFLDVAAGNHVIDPAPQDRRFRNPLWQRPPYSLLH